jgi:hypothetical protein
VHVDLWRGLLNGSNKEVGIDLKIVVFYPPKHVLKRVKRRGKRGNFLIDRTLGFSRYLPSSIYLEMSAIHILSIIGNFFLNITIVFSRQLYSTFQEQYMIKCYHDSMLSYFFPENFTH